MHIICVIRLETSTNRFKDTIAAILFTPSAAELLLVNEDRP